MPPKIRHIVLSFVGLLLAILLCGCSKTIWELSPAFHPDTPVTALSCVTPASLPSLLDLGQNRVLSCWTDYADPGGGCRTYLDIIDIGTDAVERSASIDGSLELAAQSDDHSIFFLRDYDNNCYHLLDASLAELQILPVPAMNGVFSHSGDTYFYLSDNVLCCMDTATGDCATVPLFWNLRFYSLDGIRPDTDGLILRAYTSCYDLTSCLAVVDPNSGEYEVLLDETSIPVFDADSFYAMSFNGETLNFDILYGSANGSEPLQLVSTGVMNGGTQEYTMLAQSCYVIGTDDADHTGAQTGTTVYRLGESVDGCELNRYGLSGSLRGALYLPEEALILGSIYDGNVFTLTVLDPDTMDFIRLCDPESEARCPAVDESIALQYLSEGAGQTLPESLSSVRSQADALEEKYGIRILLGDDCADLCVRSIYSVDTTEDEYAIENALTQLDEALALYPAGFTAQFQNSAGDGGLLFLLIGAIDSENSTIGFTFELNAWYCIAFDIGMGTFTGTVCHELWHATEDKILFENPTEFSSELWQTYNPDGFQYYMDYNYSDLDQSRWTYFGGGTDGVYFVDAYARVNEREDRARIMEYIMSTDGIAEDLIQSPAIYSKLSLMADTVRAYFDTTNWSGVRWERFF